ncbi:unnamed protein product [Lactuca virosa]|uniref:F-box associated domain-containing protein n=1 Tax=Lactuca virosa TaxID=75947 RepID=A0AAU9PK98_9ASTR|nr:unnamed protein product [Lactuca virosa]
MTRNQNHDDASSVKRIKSCDPWSDPNHDVLFLVMMQLGVFDFLAFSRVFVRVILVHSPPISGWVFLVLNKKTNEIWFSIASKRVWTLVSASFLIHDLYAFKGKIYVLNSAYGLYEMLLYPNPNLTLLKTKDFPELDDSSLLEFANSPENLYVINRNSQHPYKIHELDFGKMKWASLEKRTEEYALFLGNWKHHAVAIPESWVGISSQYRRLKYVRTNKGGKSKLYYASMWYFFHDFLDANLIHE